MRTREQVLSEFKEIHGTGPARANPKVLDQNGDPDPRRVPFDVPVNLMTDALRLPPIYGSADPYWVGLKKRVAKEGEGTRLLLIQPPIVEAIIMALESTATQGARPGKVSNG